MDIDVSYIKKSMNDYREANRAVERFVKSLVKECCSNLDDLMSKINAAVEDVDNPITDEELDYFILNLPIQVYHAYEKAELIGLAEDMAKQKKSAAYAEAYAADVGTIIERKQYAELAVKNHHVVVSIYNRAGKQVRAKLDMATEMLQSLKKVSTRRMAENALENSSFRKNRGEF